MCTSTAAITRIILCTSCLGRASKLLLFACDQLGSRRDSLAQVKLGEAQRARDDSVEELKWVESLRYTA